jgi:two-component system response regulator
LQRKYRGEQQQWVLDKAATLCLDGGAFIMGSSDDNLTILHVEDDPSITGLVQAAFEELGFSSKIISATRIHEALDLLNRRAHSEQPVNLILLDMQLPDGSGLDFLRVVKTDPALHMTPVIVLSSEGADGTINSAYALGANCYISKTPGNKSLFDLVVSFCGFWLQDAILPQSLPHDRLQTVLSRGARLRARSAELYMRLARIGEVDSEDAAFWLNRALDEGNLSNLMAFFTSRVSDRDVPPETVDRLMTMQAQFTKALLSVERRLENAQNYHPDQVCRMVLDYTMVLDEELFADVIAGLFPKAPEAAVALKARAAAQISSLACHVLQRTKQTELRERADSLLQIAERLQMGCGMCTNG